MVDELASLADKKERERIKSALDVNMLVEAAAGTGKTTVLLERMVELIRTGRCSHISRLAAITFTRKAAAELRSRFQSELEKAVREAGKEKNEEKKRLEDALMHIEQCFIGTIHSFCARLLRERPLEAEVDLSFEELDETEDKMLLDDAWEEFAAVAIADDPENINNKLRAVGLKLNDLKSAFEIYANFADVEAWPAMEKPPEMPTAEELNRRIRGYVEHMEEVEPQLPEEDGEPKRMKRTYRSISLKFRQNDPDDIAAAMSLIEELNRKPPSIWRSTPKEERALLKREQSLWNERKEEMDTAGLVDNWYNIRYEVAMEALGLASEHYQRMRERLGVLNFQDLLNKAARLLRETPEVRSYFAGRYSHLLVDEFQDTDPIQAEMMLLLTSSDTDTAGLNWLESHPRPGALFVVGDPKQSIYRFRRADIATYNLVKRKFEEWEDAEVLELSSNFRSVGPVLQFVHDCFSDQFEPPGQPTPESPSYVKLEKCKREAETGELTGVKVLRVPCGDNGKADPLKEADIIARFIVEAVKSRKKVTRTAPLDGEKAKPGESSWGDFMIITFKKNELEPFARRLQELGAPCRVSGSAGLASVRELKLLLTCLKAAVHPDNPVLLVAALRSELFGISDASLYRFKKEGGRFDYRCEREIPRSLPGEEKEAFADAFRRLHEYAELLDRLPPVSALERIADDLGLFALAGRREGGDVAAGSIAKALEVLRSERAGRWTVPQFLETLEELASGAVESDGMSALPERPDAVQIMNLHRVKGLQAPVVFLAGVSSPIKLESQLHIDRSDISAGKATGYMEIRRPAYNKKRGGVVACPQGWADRQKREDLFQGKEKVRLRYVGATRPESMLVVSLSAGGEETMWSHFAPALESAPELLLPEESEWEEGEKKEKEVPCTPLKAAETIRARLRKASSPTWELAAAKELALASCGRVSQRRPAPIEREMDSLEDLLEDAEKGVLWGAVVHELLELGTRIDGVDLLPAASALLEENGLDARFAPDAFALVQAVMRSTLWKRAAESQVRLAEVPFCVLLEESAKPTLLRGKIDLAFREKDGWVIVDYKTDRPTEALSSAELAEKYAPQVHLYARAWEKCTGEEVAETGIFLVTTGEYARV